ncbi:MAG: HDIG domain-containing protein [Muribaculaceae bacterium]|mgnify:CR=1 FL=1|nr:HDIG domain-containing protein [Muribaculaceae bacterium]
MGDTCNWQEIVEAYYPAGSALRNILEGHSRQVADMALAIAARKHLALDAGRIEAAAMLHDIGITRTHAPGIECHGTEPYLMHGVLGAQMLQDAGAPEWAAGVAERHTGAGLTRADVIAAGMPDPGHDLCPRDTLERLVCYADKFFSKTHVGAPPKALERVRASIRKFGPAAAERFESLHEEFG